MLKPVIPVDMMVELQKDAKQSMVKKAAVAWTLRFISILSWLFRIGAGQHLRDLGRSLRIPALHLRCSLYRMGDPTLIDSSIHGAALRRQFVAR